jgi:hypothetical protein
MLISKYRSNPHVLRDTNHSLTIQRKAFANNALSRHIASVSAYITSDRLVLEDMCLSAINTNATIHVLEENGWDHRCSTSRNLTPANTFTEGRGIPATRTISKVQSLGSSLPKTIAQLMTQRATLTNASNALPARDYTGHIVLSDAAKTTNATTGKKIMGASAFAGCSRLVSVRMSSDSAWNAFYSNGCFKSCAALATISTVTNSNSGMSLNVPIPPPAGTINVVVGSATVSGSSTSFAGLVPGQMLYSSSAISSERGGTKYIGTVKSVQNNTQLTLVLPSALAYSGTFAIATEAMIAAHVTAIGQEALRGTKVRVVSFESHLAPTVAASNSRLSSIGTNAFTDCVNLTTVHFSVKQSSALAKIGTSTDPIIPASAKLNVITSDGWSQSQLATLFNINAINVNTQITSTTKLSYIARLDPAVLDANSQPMRIATITGLAMHDVPINAQNLVIPEVIVHSDGKSYQVYDIRYPFIDQTEPIVGQTIRVYGAFSKSNPAFNLAGAIGGLSGTLIISKTLRSIHAYAFNAHSALSGDLTIACPLLSSIGYKCFESSYFNGRNVTIMNSPAVAITIERDAFRATGFGTSITLRKMTNAELITYAF